jgi:acetyl esterase
MRRYADRIDAQTWRFIDRSNAFYSPEAAGWSLQKNRDAYDAMCRAFDAGIPSGVSTDDFSMAGQGGPLPVRRYRRDDADGSAAILYLHGGGFVLGGLESHDSICAELCAGTGYDLVSVDYRLSPEHQHPAALEDAMTVFGWIATETGRPVILVGDSAGGTLAAAVCHATRGRQVRPAGQMLIYPALSGTSDGGMSYAEHADAPMLTSADVEIFRGIRSGGAQHATDATLWPLADPDFSGLPPTCIVAAEIDPLASDAEAYCRRVTDARGEASWIVEEGLVHGYLRGRHSVARARRSFARIVDAVTRLGRGDWPHDEVDGWSIAGRGA